MMKTQLNIAIVTLYTSNIEDYAKYGLLNKTAYAKKYNYDFIIYDCPIDYSRPVAWSKIKVLQKHLSHYDWVFWSDADSLIMNHEITLESFINELPDKEMILSPGGYSKFNTGEWLVKNSAWSYYVLQGIWDNVKETDFYFHQNPWEQHAFIDLSKKIPDIDTHIGLLETRKMNSRPAKQYLENEYLDLEGIEYQAGDFIIHFYHTKKLAKRIEGMKYYYQKWCENNSSIIIAESK